MNLEKLFEAQRILDARIMDKRPELNNHSNLDWKTLALQVELGELANEWRGFKKWSDNQQPRTHASRTVNDGDKLVVVPYNPMLEELVDCLHFILSIGDEEVRYYDVEVPLSMELPKEITCWKMDNTTEQFNSLFHSIGYFYDCCDTRAFGTDSEMFEQYVEIWRGFVGLGEMLGFTWEQIEVAYFEKNKINHQRQQEGY